MELLVKDESQISVLNFSHFFILVEEVWRGRRSPSLIDL